MVFFPISRGGECIDVVRQSWHSLRGTLYRVHFLWGVFPGTGRLRLPVPRLYIGIACQAFIVLHNQNDIFNATVYFRFIDNDDGER